MRVRHAGTSCACFIRCDGCLGITKFLAQFVNLLSCLVIILVFVFPVFLWTKPFSKAAEPPPRVYNANITDPRELLFQQYLPKVNFWNESILYDLFTKPDDREDIYSILFIVFHARFLLITVFSFIFLVNFLSFFAVCYESKGFAITTALFSSLGFAVATLSLLSAFNLDLNLWREAAALQLQYSFLTASNVTATRLSLDYFQTKNRCCGFIGPGDFAKENPVLKLFAGQNAVPLWFQEYNFVRVDPTPPTVNPSNVNPDESVNSISQEKQEIPLNSSVLPGFTCTGCTININDPVSQVPVPQITTTTPQPTTKSRRWKETRNDRTLPWTYQRANYPWFMGPPVRGTFCEEEPCKTERLGREASTQFPFNEETFFSQNFLIPAELNLSPGNYPVPESCCEQQSKFCGLENAILKKKLPKQIYPPVNTPNICLSNSTVPINSTVPFNTSECLPINTSTYSTPTSTDKLIENVVDNIFTEGCFPNLFEKLKSVEWLPTVLFGHVVVLLNLFLNVLFGCLMCCVSSDKPMRHVKYGKKHKVPVSRRL